MAKVYTIANWKGGVAKTTTAVNLAYGLSRLCPAKRTLLIDTDSQMNTTWTMLQKLYPAKEGTIYQSVIGSAKLAPAIQAIDTNLFFVPASAWLTGADFKLASATMREKRLSKALAPLLDQLDYVIIDTSPFLGIMTINAIVAATDILIPVTPSLYGVIGMDMFLQTIAALQENMERPFALSGVLLTQVEAQTRNAKEYVKHIRDFFGALAYETVIPKNVKVVEASATKQPLYDYAPESAGAQAYLAWVQELLKREQTWSKEQYFQQTQAVVTNIKTPLAEEGDA